jgi:hypothetical protein
MALLSARTAPLIRLFVLSAFALLGSSSMITRAADLWRPIDPSELSMRAPLVERNADAEAILWEVRVAYIENSSEVATVLDHYVRIKVFNDRGRESQSKVDIYAPQFGGRTFRISDVAARTVKPDGTAVEVKKEDIYDRAVLKGNGIRVNAKSFALPGVVPGSIVEYRWRETRNGIQDYERFDLSRDIPVQLVRYSVKPFQQTLVDSSGKAVAMRAQIFHGQPTAFAKDKDGFFGTSMKSIPAFQLEPQMPPEYAIRPWLLVYYSADADSRPDVFWKNFGRTMAAQMKPGLKVNSDIQKAAAEAIGNELVPTEKLAKIYSYVRARIRRYTDDVLKLTPEQIRKLKDNVTPADTLKRTIGSSHDIDLLFGALATAAGFEVRVAFASDRSDMFFDRSLANNYSVDPIGIAVKLAGEWRVFSPGKSYVSFGMLPWQYEGEETLIADEKEPVWIVSQYSDPAKSVEKRSGKFKLGADGVLEGDIRIELTGHFGEDEKELVDAMTPAQREQTLKNRFRGLEMTDIRIENATDPEKPIVYAFHAVVRGYAQRTGRRALFKPAFFQRGIASRFSTAERSQMVYFHFPWSEEDNIEIELPPGYQLDNAQNPQPVSAGTLGRYEPITGVTADGRKLIYKRSIYFGKDTKGLLFPVADYPTLKAFFDAIYKQDDQAIALLQSTGVN